MDSGVVGSSQPHGDVLEVHVEPREHVGLREEHKQPLEECTDREDVRMMRRVENNEDAYHCGN